MQWQRDQIMALAPDAASATAAQELTNPRKWATRGASTDLLWGECQGSGAKLYQTAIDRREPAFHCSCPSRKFPCKHGLALFLLYNQSPDTFTPAPPPDWAQRWLDGRTQRQQAKADTQAVLPESVAAQGQVKRAAARTEKVAAGIEELKMWLHDLVRMGFADAQPQPAAFWQSMAARLVDAQASGLATQVQRLGQLAVSGEGWAERLTAAVGKLFLLLEAYQRLDTLSPALQHDVRTLIGWTQPREDVLTGEGVPGPWLVLSHTVEQGESLLQQRVWLRHQHQERYALIVNFAHASNRQSLDAFWRCGSEVACTIYYYAATIPLRAVATAAKVLGPINYLGGAHRIHTAFRVYQQSLAQQPWLTNYPLLLADVVAQYQPNGTRQAQWWLGDGQTASLPLSRRAKNQWLLLSITGGNPAHCFGEWLDDGFLPLGLWAAERYWSL
ncbi:MAG: SWIM zinc finger family protein [Caldilineaceae bacterium]|nr:SWIM zinc finger family protein [Caldilineaceae bacterium]